MSLEKFLREVENDYELKHYPEVQKLIRIVREQNKELKVFSDWPRVQDCLKRCDEIADE